MYRRIALPFVFLAVLSLSLQAGCAGQCRQVEQGYRQAVAQETELAEEASTEADPAQFGLAIKTDLLNDVANTALQGVLAAGLDGLSKIDVGGGQRLRVNTRGDVVNLRVEASDACEHCFRLGGDLDGSVGVEVPVVGTQTANLDGSLSIVAPLVLARTEDGRSALQFDLSEAAKIGKSSLNTRLTNLRSSWARALQSQLADALLARLLKDVEPVTLLGFETPNFGIDGLEVFPVELVTNAKTGTIYAGFSTNVTGLEGAPGIAPVTDLADDQNLAIAFNPNLVVHALSLMMQKGVVSRTYTTDGKPARRGAAHVTIGDFGFRPGQAGELPMGLDFRVFNMGGETGGLCFWFDGRATGTIALRNDTLDVSLDQVNITDSSLPDSVVSAADWAQAQFLDGGKRIVRQSLRDENVEVPGGQLQFQGMNLELKGNAVVLKGTSQVSEDKKQAKASR